MKFITHAHKCWAHSTKDAFRRGLSLCTLLLCAATAIGQSLTLSGTNHMELGDYVTLYPNTLGGSWSSSNAGVATVDRGVVRSIATGSATISYTSTVGSVTSLATMTVTVDPVTEICRPWEGLGTTGIGTSAIGAHNAYTLDNSGTPYVAYAEPGSAQLTVKKYIGGVWTTIGTTAFTTAGADYINIAVDRFGTPYVAFADGANLKKITVMKYSGSSWVTVGSAGFSTNSVAFCRLAIDSTGTPYVAYLNYTPGTGSWFRETSSSQFLVVKKFNGTSWVDVGSLSTSPDAMWEAGNDHNSISFLIDKAGALFLAYMQAGGAVKVVGYNGSAWGDLAAPNAAWESHAPFIAVSHSNTLYLSYLNDVSGGIVAYKYQGASWTALGSIPTGNSVDYNSIAADANDNVYVCFSSSEEGYRVVKYNGSAWLSYGAYGSWLGTALKFDPDGTLYDKGVRIGRKTTPVDANTGSAIVCVGSSQQFSNATGFGFWSSSNSSILSKHYLFADLFQGVSVGTATITYTNGTCQQTNLVTVNSSPTITPNTNTAVCVGSTVTLTGTPAGGTWGSYATTAATVGTGGEVTGVAVGNATIDYIYAGCLASKSVTIDDNATSLIGPSVVNETNTIYLRTQTRYGAWSSSNSNAVIGTSNQAVNGVTGVTSGTATISFSVSNACGTSLATKVITVQPFSCTGWNYFGGAGISTGYIGYLAMAVGPTGAPYVAYSNGNTQGYARVSKYTGGAWTVLAPGVTSIAVGKSQETKIAVDNSDVPYTMFQDLGDSNKVKVFRYDTSWSLVGTAFPSTTKNAAIAINSSGTPYVVFTDYANSKKATVMKFNGSAWVAVGTAGFSGGIIDKAAIAFDGSGTPYVAYTDSSTGGKATVMKYNGSSWVAVGSTGFSAGGVNYMSIAIDGSGTPYAGFSDGANGSSITIMKYTGTSWTIVGYPAITPTTAYAHNMAFDTDGTPYLGYPGGVMYYDGNGWRHKGMVSGELSELRIDGSGNKYVAFRDWSSLASGRVSVMKFGSGLPAITGVGGVCPGATITLANTNPGGTWSSSSATIATIGSTGIVTGVGTGLTTISYAIGSCVATRDVVSGAYAGILNGPYEVRQGATATLLPTVTGGVWTTSNSNATVSTTGVVSGVAMGTVTITYTVYSTCGTTSVTRDMTVILPGITGILSVVGSGTTTLSNAIPGGTWSTGCSEIATVSSDGTVTGVSNGMATITYTAAGDFVTAVVTVNTSTSAITGTRTFCLGATTDLDHSIAGGAWSSSSDSIATVDSNGIVSGIAAGTATISYDYGSGCTSTVTVTVNALPSAGTIAGATTVNVGANISLSPSVTGGTWSAANSHATVSATGVVTGMSAGSVVISYSVGSSCGTAVATKNILVAVDTSSSVNPITGTLSLCAGTTTVLGNATSGGSWSSSDITVATIATDGVVTGVAPGVTTISYTTSAGVATAIVTVSAAPAITGIANICPGTTTTLSTTGTGGSWTGGIASIAIVGSTGIVTGVGTGTANITYSLGTGCRASVAVTVGSAPSSITGTLKACPGTSTALSSMTPGGSWSTSDATIATAGASTGIISGVAAGTVTVTYTTGAGCYRTATVTINAAPAPIAGAMLICAGSTTSLTDASPGLSWTSGNTAVATVGATGVVNGVSNGLATITYTAASTNCITTAEVTVNGVPASIAGPATGCAGWDIALTNGVPGGVWSSSNVATATVDASTGVVTGVASGIVTITYTTGAGCYKTKQITINNSPAVTGYPTACVGLTTTLSGGASGTWSSSTPAVATIVTSGGYVTGVSAGTSTMTFTSTGTGCRATYTVSVIPVPSAITGPTQACTGAVLALTNSTPGGVWTSANTANATVGSATGITTIVGTGGSVTISYSFGNNCRATKAISLKPLPAVINGSPTVCTPVTTTLTTVTSGGTWTSSDASVATVGTAISASYGLVTGVSAGTAEITYTITSTGCARSTVVTVNAGLNPGTITSSGGFTLHTVSPLTSVTLSSTGASGGTWTSSNPAVATINPSTGLVTAVAAGTTTITYAVTASCTNITTKVITVTAGRPAGGAPVVSNIQLYPNPTTGSFTLVSEEAGTLHLFSIDGKAITSFDIKAGINPLTLPAGLASGIYMCRYTGENGATTMVRLVYER